MLKYFNIIVYKKVRNGLDHPEIVSGINGISSALTSSGSRFAFLNIDPETGVSEPCTIEQYARIESNTVLGNAHAHAPNLRIDIENKTVGVEQFISPSYEMTLGPAPSQTQKRQIHNQFIDNIRLQTVMQFDPLLDRYIYLADVNSVLVGNWNLPTTVSMQPTANIPSNIAHIIKNYSDQQLQSMITSGTPDVVDIQTVASDGITTRYGFAKLSIFSPICNPTELSDERVYGEWYKIQDEVLVIPGAVGVFTHTISDTQSHTTGISFGISIPVSAKIKEIFSAGVTGSATWTDSQTAEISSSIANGQQKSNTAEVPYLGYLKRRGYHRVNIGVCHYYDQHGYGGVTDYEVHYFESGTKELAEIHDKQTTLHWEPWVVPF